MQLRAGVLGTGMLRPGTRGTTDRSEIFHCVLVEGRSVCAFDEIVLMLLRSPACRTSRNVVAYITGIAGLLCAHARRHPLPTVLLTGSVGGPPLAGAGFRYHRAVT